MQFDSDAWEKSVMKFVGQTVLSAAMLFAAAAAHALEFKSVGAAPAVLYDAPSAKGRKVFVAPSGMPVEVVLTYGEWTKVRDAVGDLAWVESKSLIPKRNVVASVAGARVRAAPEETSAVVFTTDKGVLLELLDVVAAGWVKVRHGDGQGGFVRVAEVWGE
jgi:SH3-like domain-containing protein